MRPSVGKWLAWSPRHMAQLPASLGQAPLQGEQPRRRKLVNQRISFSLWYLVGFILNSRALENETKVVVTVTIGGEENPRVLGNLCLAHCSCTTRICLGRGEEEAKPTVSKKTETQKGPEPKQETEAWLPRLESPQSYKQEKSANGPHSSQAGLRCKCIPLISLDCSTVSPEDRPGLETTRNPAGAEGGERGGGKGNHLLANG